MSGYTLWVVTCQATRKFEFQLSSYTHFFQYKSDYTPCCDSVLNFSTFQYTLFVAGVHFFG